jgi:AraC-like DNA-binding protein
VFRVGYESPSQFSREYRRLFGAPPGQDVAGSKVEAQHDDLVAISDQSAGEQGADLPRASRDNHAHGYETSEAR